MDEEYKELVQMNARQLNSGLVKAICAAQGISLAERSQWRVHSAELHFHDDSTHQIVWNNVQAIIAYNELTGDNVPVPLMATEGYNDHGHTSKMDGGFLPGAGVHDHRDNLNGGYCFSVYHPGTSLPQQPWAQ